MAAAAAGARHDRRAVGRGQAGRGAQPRRDRRRAARARRARSGLASFSREFRAGMAARAPTLGDAGPSDPAAGSPSCATAPARAGDGQRARRGALERELGRLRDDAAHTGGVAVAYEQATELLPARASTSATPTASPSRPSPGSTTRSTGASAAGSPRRRAPGARSRPASSSSATRTRTRAWTPARIAERAGRPVRALGHLHGVAQAPPGRRALPPRAARGRRALRWRRPREARGQGGRALAQGTPLVASPDAPIADFDPKTDPRTNGFRYARGLPRRALPARRAHPPHQPARRARLRRAAQLPPPHHPARDALRGAAPPRPPRTTTSTAA